MRRTTRSISRSNCIAQAIRCNQANPDYFSSLGALLARRDRLDEAFKSYDLALKLKPDFVEVWIALGDLLQRQQGLQQALLAYEHVLTLDAGHAGAAEKARAAVADAATLRGGR